MTVQAPVPTEGELPARVVLATPTCSSGPALAVVGFCSLVINTVSREDPHESVLIVQTNEFTPTDKPVTPDVGELGEVTVAPPATTAHEALPDAGEFADREADDAHTV